MAVHAEAPSSSQTDWGEIVGLYDHLSKRAPTPVVRLNRAVAVAMRDGPKAGLDLVDELKPELENYHLFHAARADLCRRLGRFEEAREAYSSALRSPCNDAERRFLERRRRDLERELVAFDS